MSGLIFCRYCETSKPKEAFNFRNRAKGTRQQKCRECFRVYNRKRYEVKGEHVRAVVRAYQEANSEAVSRRKRAAYWRDVELSRSLGRANASVQNAKPSRQAAKREWATNDRAANPEKWREKGRREYRANPTPYKEQQYRRRALKLATMVVRLAPEQLAAKWAYWAGRCWICGAEASEWDHVKPLNQGGGHILSNLRPACLPCNRSKSDRWPYVVRSIRSAA